jgi:hypothetical protein
MGRSPQPQRLGEGLMIDDAPAAFERLRDANTMKILIAPNSQ